MSVRDLKLYEVLEVAPTATTNEIIKSYKRLAIIYHPDRNGGDPIGTEKFKAIYRAYKILSDEPKRMLYNLFGEEALNDAQKMDPEFIKQYDMNTVIRGQDVVHHQYVTLEDLYAGASVIVKFMKRTICSHCEGKGTPMKDMTYICMCCGGTGLIFPAKSMAFGLNIVTDQAEQCPTCKGAGCERQTHGRCRRCSGDRILNQVKEHQVLIKAGLRTGHRIVLKGEGHQAPGGVPGDLLIVVHEQDHPVFKRQKNDLIIEHELSLAEALTGFQFVIKHLDHRLLGVSSRPGQIIKPGDEHIILNEGMPSYNDVLNRGHLVVKFRVKFPESHELSDQTAHMLKRLLPGPTHNIDFSTLSGVQHVRLLDSRSMQIEEEPKDPFILYSNDEF